MKKIEFKGIGVHSALPCLLTISPSPENTGIVFKRVDVKDKNNLIELKAENVVEPVMCTKIINSDGISVSVIEHLMAALRISGVTNAIIEVDNEEIPIMDGSAAIFLKKILKTGIVKQNARVKAILINSEVSIRADKSSISVMPSINQNINIELDYDRINNVIKNNRSISFGMKDKAKLQSIATARTFGWLEDCEKIRTMGLAGGSSLENTVIIARDNSVINEEGLRSKNEIIQHKALDLIGDFSLIGYDIIGSITGVNTSHLQNNLFLKKLKKEISLHTILQTDNEFQQALQNRENHFETQVQLVC